MGVWWLWAVHCVHLDCQKSDHVSNAIGCCRHKRSSPELVKLARFHLKLGSQIWKWNEHALKFVSVHHPLKKEKKNEHFRYPVSRQVWVTRNLSLASWLMPNERPKLSRNPLAGWKVLPNVGGDSPLMKVHDKKHLQLSSPDWEAMFRLAPPSIRAFAALWVRFQPTIQQECTLWRLEDTSSVNSRHLMGIFDRTHHCADSNARSPCHDWHYNPCWCWRSYNATLYCSL